MNDTKRDNERDKVLFEMHKAFRNPTAELIIQWVERYPQYADDIRSHAAIMKDWAASEDKPVLEPDAAMISRSRSRVMSASTKPVLLRRRQGTTRRL